MTDPSSTNCIQQVVDSQSIQTYFQPVVSIRSESVLGFEAFSRGTTENGNKRVDASALFDPSLDDATQLKIETICSSRAVNKFKSICQAHPQLLLFLNINLQAFENNMQSLHSLYDLIRQAPFAQNNVVLEIKADHLLKDKKHIADFVAFHADKKFLLSLDDLKNDAQSIDNIHKIHPDFIKIGRSYFDDLQNTSYKKDILTSLQKISEEAGSHLIAKGVEKEHEAISLLECGIHVQQGYYYTKSQSSSEKDAVLIFTEKIRELGKRYTAQTCKKIKVKRQTFKKYDEILKKCIYRLGNHYHSEFAEALQRYALNFQDIWSCMILNNTGQEIAHFAHHKLSGNKDRVKGTNHASEDYYLYLTLDFEKFVTNPFYSQENKRQHCIISRPFFAKDSRKYFACFEFPYADENRTKTAPARHP